MTRRLPSTPPSLPGFSFVRVLGSGGFADVFLYEQNMPRRLVAVKVLLADLVNDDVRQMFQAEANLMAQLSSHPSILTVYQASVAADGRPYLVMEYCSSTLAQRYRAVQLPLSEALSIGVRIASAVETAHREGVLHRDIKPSNILTTAYGHPVLSDFGIAATLGDAASSESVGLSIPWSAPEVVRDETAGTVSSEVWSLGATVFSLLAGRSPFEVVGGDNSSTALIQRIEKGKPPRIERADVPAALEAVLARAMSRRPAARHASAMEFLRDLQGVEEELGLAQTPAEVALDDWALATALDVDDRTRVSGAYAIAPVPGRRRRKRPALDAAASGSSSPGPGGDDGAAVDSAPRRVAVGLSIAAGLLVLLVGAGIAVALSLGDDIPVVEDVRATAQGTTAVFEWDDPGIEPGDVYLVRVDGVDAPAQRATSLEVASPDGERVCASVRVSREGVAGAQSPERCIEPGASG